MTHDWKEVIGMQITQRNLSFCYFMGQSHVMILSSKKKATYNPTYHLLIGWAGLAQGGKKTHFDKPLLSRGIDFARNRGSMCCTSRLKCIDLEALRYVFVLLTIKPTFSSLRKFFHMSCRGPISQEITHRVHMKLPLRRYP